MFHGLSTQHGNTGVPVIAIQREDSELCGLLESRVC